MGIADLTLGNIALAPVGRRLYSLLEGGGQKQEMGSPRGDVNTNLSDLHPRANILGYSLHYSYTY